MSQQSQEPAERIADALGDVSEHTRRLVRQEVASARQEVIDRLKAGAPGMGLAGLSMGLGLVAAASGYRLLLRILERFMPPTAAALTATVVPGGLAAVTAVAAKRSLSQAPAPLPTDTVAATGEAAKKLADRLS